MHQTKAFDRVRAHAPTLSCGILSADLVHLESEVRALERTELQVLHFDVMDGCFVPMMTAGPPLIKAIKTSLLKDAHLMVADPLNKVDDYVTAGSDIITVHVEAAGDILSVLAKLGRMENANHPGRGLVRGVAINPQTELKVLEPLLEHLEMIVVLAVDPNDLGKGFFDSTFDRFAAVKQMVASAGRDVILCVDGGVKLDNIAEIARMGADLVVSGSALFKGAGPSENIPTMLNALKSGTGGG